MAQNADLVQNAIGFLYKTAAERGPGSGKRPVRIVNAENVAATIANAGAMDEEEDDDDFDFVLDESGDNSGNSSVSSVSSSDNDERDSSSSDDQNIEDEAADLSFTNHDASCSHDSVDDIMCIPASTSHTKLNEQASCSATSLVPHSEQLICQLCLNFRSELSDLDGGEEVIQCDKCGLAVHEHCYGCIPNETASTAPSTASSDSTEPWFCDVCLANLDEPPDCELCPAVGGAYKRTDWGRWVHLLCSLYIPGTTYGEVECLSPVSLREIGYENYGARPCSLCADKLMARTGISIKCDAGMCRTAFHVTCAQQQGLLSEIPASPLKGHDPACDSTGSHAAPCAADCYYAACAVHTDKDIVKVRKGRFKMSNRQLTIWRKNKGIMGLTPREMDRLKALQSSVSKTIGVIAPPLPKNGKYPRLLHTNAGFLRKMAKKQKWLSEVSDKYQERLPWPPESIERRLYNGQTRLIQWNQDLVRSEIVGKHVLPVGFAPEFCWYFHERDNLLTSLEAKQSQLTSRCNELKQQQMAVSQNYSGAEIENNRVSSLLQQEIQLAKMYRDTLGLLECNCVKLNRVIDGPGYRESFNQSVSIGDTSGGDVYSYGLRKKQGRPKRQHTRVDNEFMGCSSEKSSRTSSTVSSGTPDGGGQQTSATTARVHLHSCSECKSIVDQHLLVYCETCKTHCHLRCLDPPLARMPKLNAKFGWECSKCGAESSSESEVDVEAPRKLRQSIKPTQRFVIENGYHRFPRRSK